LDAAWRGKKLGMICSGGNLSLPQLQLALSEAQA